MNDEHADPPDGASAESAAVSPDPEQPWWATQAVPASETAPFAPPPAPSAQVDPLSDPLPAADAAPPADAPAYETPTPYVSPYAAPTPYAASPSYPPAQSYPPPAPYAASPSYPPSAYSPPPTYPQQGYSPPSASAPSAVGYDAPYAPYAPYPTGQPPAGPVTKQQGGRRGGWPTLLVVAGISALIGALVAGGLVAANKKTTTTPAASIATSSGAPAQVASQAPAVALPAGSVAQVARTLLPSVVSIIVTAGDSGDEGTGIVLSADGDILTNNHVVESAATSGVIAVTINDGRTVKATIVGRDPTTDLAVIKAAGVTDLHPAKLGQDAALTVGQPVIAIGSPLGLSNTVTSGIISSLNRPVCTQDCEGSAGGATSATPTVLDAIQTDAAINPGNSGGPLVDMAGDVVGVNSAIATLDEGQDSSDAQSGSIGVGFSIPIDEARRVVSELEATGHANHAVLGIGLQDSLDAALHTPNGARVVQVVAGEPASKVGIKADDVIVKFGDRTIVDADSLIAATHAAVPSSTVAITYIRDGQSTTVQLTLGSAASS
jgi:putative serine protease PepD